MNKIKIRMTAVGMIVVTVGWGMGCRDNDWEGRTYGEDADTAGPEAVTREDVRREAAEAVGVAIDLADQTRDQFMERVRSEMKNAGERLDNLRERGRTLGEEAGKEWNERVAQLDRQRDALQERLEEVAVASGDAWRELARGMTQARKDMAEALREAEAEFKQQPADEPKQASPGEGG